MTREGVVRLLCVAAMVMGCDDEPDDGAGPVALEAGPADRGVADATPDAMDDMRDAMPDVMDAMPDAAVDAMPESPCGTACTAIAWIGGPALPRVSDHHTTLVEDGPAGPALVVVGGIESDAQGGAAVVSDRIDRSPIGADGLLAGWDEAGRLPFPLAFHGQARAGERVFLVAGVTADEQGPLGSRAVLMLTVGGEAPEVVECDDLPAPAVHPTAEVLGERLYVIGGSQGAPVDRVWVASIAGGGCPEAWAAAPALPEPRSHHASAVHDGRIHVLGGFGASDARRPTVLRSVHGEDGALTGWEAAGELPASPWTASALVIDDAIWLFGGGEGGGALARFVDTVRRAGVVDGMVGAFEGVDAPLPIARSHVHQTPRWGRFVYSVGGRVFSGAGFELESTDRVFVGRLSAD